MTPGTVATQALLSMGFFQARTLEWVAISYSRMEPMFLKSPVLQEDSLPLSHLGSPFLIELAKE